MRRVAMLSFHTSPLAQPGAGDSGGMNVYVRETASALAHRGLECITYTRSSDGIVRDRAVEPGYRVVELPAGDGPLDKEQLPSVVEEFTDAVDRHMRAEREPVDVMHANYWLSGMVAHRLKHLRDIPFVTTFHTLARVKIAAGDDEPQQRVDAETAIARCTDAVCVSCEQEADEFASAYGHPPGEQAIVAPGVEHALFSPGARSGARSALGLGAGPVITFVGRIQALKGLDVAVRAFAELDRRDATLLVVGGPSGLEGRAELARVRQLASDLGVARQMRLVAPQPHHILSTYYRASDMTWVPSRSESFGLVALEAAACGIPIVASAVGGLLSLVDHGRTGYLVPGRASEVFAGHAHELLDDPGLAASMGAAAAERARRYTWGAAAERLHQLYEAVAAAPRRVLDCREAA